MSTEEPHSLQKSTFLTRRNIHRHPQKAEGTLRVQRCLYLLYAYARQITTSHAVGVGFLLESAAALCTGMAHAPHTVQCTYENLERPEGKKGGECRVGSTVGK